MNTSKDSGHLRVSLAAAVLAIALSGLGAGPVAAQQSAKMNFFITSVGMGKGADLGGLDGADRHCAQLAYAVGAGDRTWHAYLSTTATDNTAAVNARDRIGRGPWYNAKGEVVAQNVADLHSENNKLGKQTSLTEKGGIVNGRGDTPNTHDMLTGSTLDGMAYPKGDDTTCSNWTSGADGSGAARLGHFDRQGGGENPTSWNSAHPSRGCSQANLQASGGAGLFYCFAID
jgi:hypothetical protein